MNDNLLYAQVTTVNDANVMINQALPAVRELLKGYVGRKVDLATGGMPKALRNALAPILARAALIDGKRHSVSDYVCVTFDVDRYNVWLRAKTCRMVDSYTCHYYTAVAYLGGMADGLFNKLAEMPAALRTDWTVAEVMHKREAFREAECQVSRAQAELGPFSE